ncbi:MAG: N-acetylmuramoyl-L-alanine amidase [Bacteroidota bacterium]
MKYLFNIVIFISILSTCFGQNVSTPSKIKYYVDKAEKYLDFQKALSTYYTIDERGIGVYANPKDKINNKPEYYSSWDSIERLRHPNRLNMDTINSLLGYKIAIDAGHTAGNLASGRIEQKFIRFKLPYNNGKVDSIELAEGELTYATSVLLKKKLEAKGAEVLLTRKFNGATSFGVSFDDWLRSSFKNAVDSLCKISKINEEKRNWLLTKATKRDKFKLVFKEIELQKRAEIINQFHPDFTIIIHYNVDETNTGWTKPTKKDFNMAFVGGAFMKSDLLTSEKRFSFFHLLVSDDLENSIQLSSQVIRSFETSLSVKTASINDAKYLKEGCLPTSENGVFCRNLQLTRYVHSPLVYGETLYQDNFEECVLLNKETDKTKNVRIMQVANAYFIGVMNYVFKKSTTNDK